MNDAIFSNYIEIFSKIYVRNLEIKCSYHKDIKQLKMEISLILRIYL